jgi:hypothetical protein
VIEKMDGQQAATQLKRTARIFMLWMSPDSPRNVILNVRREGCLVQACNNNSSTMEI